MNKVYTLAGLLLLATGGPALAQGTELFLSEYDEGAHPSGATACPNTPGSQGNEKALEIFNPTTSTVPLDKYSIRRYSNGTTTAFEEERLQPTTGPATLATGGTYVIANPTATLGIIVAAANQLSAAYQTAAAPNVLAVGGTVYFNGDDAMALVRWTGAAAGQGTPIIIDILGIVGDRPAPRMGSTQGRWSGADSTGIFVETANQSLRRRHWVSGGNTTWNLITNPGLTTTDYNPGEEWEAYGFAFPPPPGVADPCAQSYTDLGTHTYTGPRGVYGATGLLEEFNNSISFYPNPAHGRVNLALAKGKVGMLTILNGTGKSIVVRPGAAEQTTIDVSSLTPGVYFVRCTSADGQLTIYKELMVQ